MKLSPSERKEIISIQARFCNISNVSHLCKAFSSLSILDLSNNNILNFDALRDSLIRQLTVNSCNISSLTQIPQMQQLTTLSITKNHISKIKVSHLPVLQLLNVQENEICSISQCEQQSTLQILNMNKNAIEDVKDIAIQLKSIFPALSSVNNKQIGNVEIEKDLFLKIYYNVQNSFQNSAQFFVDKEPAFIQLKSDTQDIFENQHLNIIQSHSLPVKCFLSGKQVQEISIIKNSVEVPSNSSGEILMFVLEKQQIILKSSKIQYTSIKIQDLKIEGIAAVGQMLQAKVALSQQGQCIMKYHWIVNQKEVGQSKEYRIQQNDMLQEIKLKTQILRNNNVMDERVVAMLLIDQNQQAVQKYLASCFQLHVGNLHQLYISRHQTISQYAFKNRDSEFSIENPLLLRYEWKYIQGSLESEILSTKNYCRNVQFENDNKIISKICINDCVATPKYLQAVQNNNFEGYLIEGGFITYTGSYKEIYWYISEDEFDLIHSVAGNVFQLKMVHEVFEQRLYLKRNKTVINFSEINSNDKTVQIPVGTYGKVICCMIDQNVIVYPGIIQFAKILQVQDIKLEDSPAEIIGNVILPDKYIKQKQFYFKIEVCVEFMQNQGCEKQYTTLGFYIPSSNFSLPKSFIYQKLKDEGFVLNDNVKIILYFQVYVKGIFIEFERKSNIQVKFELLDCNFQLTENILQKLDINQQQSENNIKYINEINVQQFRMDSIEGFSLFQYLNERNDEKFLKIYDNFIFKCPLIERIRLRRIDFCHNNLFIQQLVRRDIVQNDDFLYFDGIVEIQNIIRIMRHQQNKEDIVAVLSTSNQAQIESDMPDSEVLKATSLIQQELLKISYNLSILSINQETFTFSIQDMQRELFFIFIKKSQNNCLTQLYRLRSKLYHVEKVSKLYVSKLNITHGENLYVKAVSQKDLLHSTKFIIVEQHPNSPQTLTVVQPVSYQKENLEQTFLFRIPLSNFVVDWYVEIRCGEDLLKISYPLKNKPILAEPEGSVLSTQHVQMQKSICSIESVDNERTIEREKPLSTIFEKIKQQRQIEGPSDELLNVEAKLNAQKYTQSGISIKTLEKYNQKAIERLINDYKFKIQITEEVQQKTIESVKINKSNQSKFEIEKNMNLQPIQNQKISLDFYTSNKILKKNIKLIRVSQQYFEEVYNMDSLQLTQTGISEGRMDYTMIYDFSQFDIGFRILLQITDGQQQHFYLLNSNYVLPSLESKIHFKKFLSLPEFSINVVQTFENSVKWDLCVIMTKQDIVVKQGEKVQASGSRNEVIVTESAKHEGEIILVVKKQKFPFQFANNSKNLLEILFILGNLQNLGISKQQLTDDNVQQRGKQTSYLFSINQSFCVQRDSSRLRFHHQQEGELNFSIQGRNFSQLIPTPQKLQPYFSGMTLLCGDIPVMKFPTSTETSEAKLPLFQCTYNGNEAQIQLDECVTLTQSGFIVFKFLFSESKTQFGEQQITFIIQQKEYLVGFGELFAGAVRAVVRLGAWVGE